MKYILLNIVTILFSISVFAQAPNNFNYQGLARNGSGQALANQTIGLQISILDVTATGTLLYKETFSVQTDNNGLFNILVGNGVVTNGSFSAINWAVNSKFLKVEMDALGGTNYILMGTNQLLSVPYALYSSNGSKWNTNGNNISYNNGNVGIGTQTPSSALTVTGNSPMGLFTASQSSSDNGAFVKIETNDYRGSLTLGGSQFTAPLNAGRLLHTTGGWQWNQQLNIMGNVGIGINTPQAKFHINGHLLIHNRNQKILFGQGVNVPLDSAVSIYRPNGDDGLAITSRGLYVTTSYATAPIVFSYRTLETAPAQTRFVFNMQLMRFGVGTDIPKSSIHVATGDVYLSNSSNGIILTSPNGQCYRVTVSNTGTLVNTLITCP